MRQVKLLALMTALSLTLCSCGVGQTAEEKALELQEEYAAWDTLTITADVTADYGDRVYDFKLRYTGNDTEGTIEVLEPEAIAGLTATVSPDGSSLSFDGAELSLGELSSDGLSPMDCLPMMIEQWSKGFVDRAETDSINGTDTLAVTYTVSENEYLITWFEADTNLPVRAEIYFDGSMVICCEFENIIT